MLFISSGYNHTISCSIINILNYIFFYNIIIIIIGHRSNFQLSQNIQCLNCCVWNIHGQIIREIFRDPKFLCIPEGSHIVGCAELHTENEAILKGSKLLKQQINQLGVALYITYCPCFQTLIKLLNFLWEIFTHGYPIIAHYSISLTKQSPMHRIEDKPLRGVAPLFGNTYQNHGLSHNKEFPPATLLSQ